MYKIFILLILLFVEAYSINNVLPQDNKESKLSARSITNGYLVDGDDERWKFTVSLDYKSRSGNYTQFCSGSLIAPKWVLISAYCVTDENGAAYTIDTSNPSSGWRVGINTNASYNYDYLTRIPVHQFIIHEDYNLSTHEHDIALIELETAAPSTVQTISYADEFGHDLFNIVGWGNYGDLSSYKDLYEGQVDLITNKYCNIIYPNKIKNGMICTQGDAHYCTGSNGTPLVRHAFYVEKRLYGIGIGGSVCSDDNNTKPDVYTKVLYYKNWIDSHGLDIDHDGILDHIDSDDDNDGINDSDEIANGLNPLDASDAQEDIDGDGFTNLIEIVAGSDIHDAQSRPIWAPILVADIVTFVPYFSGE